MPESNASLNGDAPHFAHLALRRVLELLVDAAEFLDPLAGLYFRGVDIPLPVDRDVVERGELARLASGPAEATDHLLRDALDDTHLAVHAVDHVHEAIAALRREHQVAR